MRTAKLSPSDFAFLYEDCKRCFYLKVVKEIRQPSKPMAAIFTKIDKQEKVAFQDVIMSTLADGLPDGQIVKSDKWVTSTYINYPEFDYRQFIFGQVDSIMQMPDKSYKIIDFKTSSIKKENDDGTASKHMKLYKRQLHAYAYALENPMYEYERFLEPGEISGMGLITFDPDQGFKVDNESNGILKGSFKWEEITYEPNKFIGFMGKMAQLLANPEIPDFNPDCPYCKRDLLMMNWDKQEVTEEIEDYEEV